MYSSKRVKLTFALKEYCSFLLYATEVIAATLAHVGLFIWKLQYASNFVRHPRGEGGHSDQCSRRFRQILFFVRDIKQGAKPEGERKKCQKHRHIVLPATPMGSTLNQLSPIYQNNGPYKR